MLRSALQKREDFWRRNVNKISKNKRGANQKFINRNDNLRFETALTGQRYLKIIEKTYFFLFENSNKRFPPKKVIRFVSHVYHHDCVPRCSFFLLFFIAIASRS